MSKYTPNDAVSGHIQTFQLKVREYIMCDLVGPDQLKNIMLEFDISRDYFRDAYRMRFYAGIAAQKLDEKRCQYPADWKEAFKERWAPKWLLKKYPVKYTYLEMFAHQLYPDIKIPNGYGPVFEVHQWNGINEE